MLSRAKNVGVASEDVENKPTRNGASLSLVGRNAYDVWHRTEPPKMPRLE